MHSFNIAIDAPRRLSDSERPCPCFRWLRNEPLSFHRILPDARPDIPRLSEELGLPLSAEFYENAIVETGERRALETNNVIRHRLTDLLTADVAFYERLRCQIT
jgi:hypothetical protein